MPKIQALTVIANPWHALDAEGCPAAHVHKLGTSVVIGGETNFEESKRRGVFVFRFHDKPVTLRPGSPAEAAHYLRQIADGALIAADEATATRAKVPFLEPGRVLAKAKADALDAYVDEHGELPEWLAAHDAEAHESEPDDAAVPPERPSKLPPAPPAPSAAEGGTGAPTAPLTAPGEPPPGGDALARGERAPAPPPLPSPESPSAFQPEPSPSLWSKK